MTINKKLFTILILLAAKFATAQGLSVESPDKRLIVNLSVNEGKPYYSVTYLGRMMMDDSPMGLVTNEDNLSASLKLINSEKSIVKKSYTMDRAKTSAVRYEANKLICTLEDTAKQQLNIVFQVSNNNIAFRYELPASGKHLSCVVENEVTGYRFPNQTTAFLSSNLKPMGGWARTHPSYESEYATDLPLTQTSKNGEGFVFPALFKIGPAGWVLLSETGVTGQYCASHLSEYKDGQYTITYPNAKQNNGFGSTGAAVALPAVTPWRTITVSDQLAPIVETTIPFDVVDPQYLPSTKYKFGRATWSWLLWQDESMNYEDQVRFIDLAATMGYEYILIDALWDEKIGRERMAELVKYANGKKVDVLLWYNSNGPFNDAPQGPRNKMYRAIDRKQEMQWLRRIGVKGLKIDFFGGDKQETMRLYEDILSDANDYGLMIEFHGTTLPRGWERMYPNYTGSEAVMSSEMLNFYEEVREREAVNAALHPFIRNTVGSMDFGPVILNKYLNRDNRTEKKRLTTETFQLATAVLFQNPIQPYALAPNNLSDATPAAITFMKGVPTTWDETRYLDGYPGKYVVLARKHGADWHVAGINAGKQAVNLRLNLPMLTNKTVKLYYDDSQSATTMSEIAISSKGEYNVVIQPNSGFVINSNNKP